MSQQINLYSPIFRRQKKYFSADTMLVALLMVLGAMGALVTYATMQVRALEAQAAQTSAQLKSETNRLTAMVADKSGETRAKAREVRLKEAESALESKKRFTAALASDALGNTRGFSETFRAFARQAMDGLWLTQISVDGDSKGLSLTGRALRAELVPEYVDRLRRESTLRGYSFGSLEISAESSTDESPGAKPSPTRRGQFAFSLRVDVPEGQEPVPPPVAGLAQ